MTSELRPAVDWQEAYFDLVNKVECECVQQGDLVPIWDQFKRMSLTIQKLQGNQAALEAELAKFKALAETLAGALGEMQSYGCPVCNGDCGSANPPVMSCPMSQCAEALRQYKEARHD